MEQVFNDAPRNPVPYRATRTLPNLQTNERRFEPSWARNTSNSGVLNSNRFPTPSLPTGSPVFYTRENIFKIINSIHGPPSPPPQDLQACPQIISMDTGVALKLLDKTYYTPSPNEFDHMPPSYTISMFQPKTFESRGLSGRGRGRGMDFGGGWTNSFESNAKWSSFSRGPVWRSRFSSEGTDLPSSYPRRRVVSECSHGESVSEGLSESPQETGPEWQFFPGDETCEESEYSNEREQDGKFPSRSNSQNNSFDDKKVSWPDTSSFSKSPNFKVDNPISTQQKERESHSFTFLNPSNVETPDISNANQSNSISPVNSDDKLEQSYLLRSVNPDVDALNQPSSNLIPDSQDPRHLWYYVDPKGSVQGPFHSDQMDSWYGRKFFPPTLPIWRECDTQPFNLANLLNNPESKQPFFIGAERLLISKEVSSVEVPYTEEISRSLPDTVFDSRLATIDQSSSNTNMSSSTKTAELTLKIEASSDGTEKYGTHSREKATQQSNINHSTSFSTDSSPNEHSEMVTLPSPPEEVFQHISLESSQEIANKNISPEPMFTPPITTTGQIRPQPTNVNLWLSGPPKIPEQLTKAPTHVPPVVDTCQIQTSQPPSNTKDETSKDPKLVAQQPGSEGMNRLSENKNKVKSKSTSSTIDTHQDKTGWTKVGMEKKLKAKAKKVALSDSYQTEIQTNLTPEETVQKNQLKCKVKRSSSNRSKLDELDSFFLGRQTVPLIPPQNDIPVVNFDTILTDQSREEESNSVIKKTILENTKEEECLAHTKKTTWASSPTETETETATATTSFLDIESEQKKTVQEDAARAEEIRTKEAHTANQPANVSTWARITKKDKQHTDCLTAGVCTVSNKEIAQTNEKDPSVPIAVTEVTIRIPVINSKSEIYVKPKYTESATKPQTSGTVPDGILLSSACYEWARKEILSLNKGMDPPTVISFLQDFNGLFEITQLGSEMFGTSERTNALCKRIYEDLARVKKYKHKITQLQSADEDWVKISKKSNKSTKKKGKPSKSSED